MTRNFELTGKHVLMAICGFFAVIFLANGVFLTLAIRSYPGEYEKKSYLQGKNYNALLRQRQTQAALGWNVSIEQFDVSDKGSSLMLKFSRQDGTPLSALMVEGSLSRPTDNHADQLASFEETTTAGLYRATFDELAQGQWRLEAEAVDGTGRQFEVATKVIAQ